MKYNKEEIQKKIEQEKKKKALKEAEPEMILTMPIPEIKGFDKYDAKVTENLTKLYTEIEKLYTVVDKALENESINNESLVEVNNNLVTMQQALLEKGLNVKHINKLEEVTKVAIENLSEIKMPKNMSISKVQEIKEIKELPKWLASEKGIQEVNKNLANIAEQLGNLETNPPGQNPEDFVPFRRVYKSGNRLVFDDTSWTGARGGGGSGGGGTTGEVIIKDAGGEQATVTNGKLDVNASVSTAGLATDTNQTNGSQKTQIVDAGGEVATVTGGKLDVNATVSAASGEVDAGNSTTTPLGSGGTFTGTGKDVLAFGSIEVFVYSNKASADEGLQIQFSQDNTNWEDAATFTFTPGSAGPNQGNIYIVPVRAYYYRIVYTNTNSAQTTFRLQSVLKPQDITGGVIALGTEVTTNNHAQLTIANIVGLSSAGGGTYVPVKVAPSGSMETSIGDVSGITGQDTMANSVPVVIASDQSAVPISDNGGSITIDGTVTANAGTGTMNVSVQNASIPVTDNGGSLTVDGIVAATQSGTWTLGANSGIDIGDVTINNASGASAVNIQDGGNSITVDNAGTFAVQSTLQAGTNLIGKVSSSNETSTMYDGTTALTPKFAAISAASSGNNTLIAAVASKKIRVLALNLISAAANNIYITSGAGGTAIWAGSTNKANFAANGGMVLPYNPVGWFETLATNTALVANLSAASAIGGSITYIEV